MTKPNEAHTCIRCPHFAPERAELRAELSNETGNAVFREQSDTSMLHSLFASTSPEDWKAIGKFVGRLRQKRRSMKHRFETMQHRLAEQGFANRKAAWCAQGRTVCRHGVFFASPSARACPCMGGALPSEEGWRVARWMPAIDMELKRLVVVPFNLATFRRIGVLRGELRRRDW